MRKNLRILTLMLLVFSTKLYSQAYVLPGFSFYEINQVSDFNSVKQNILDNNKVNINLSLDNEITEIPKDFFTGLNNIQMLKISQKPLLQEDKGVRILPESICELNRLNRLLIVGFPLVSLPKTIGKLSKLQYLGVINTNITDLPKSIGNLSFLVALKLSNNNIKFLPESIGNLVSLVSLNIENNNLIGLPSSIDGLVFSLANIAIGGNNIISLSPMLLEMQLVGMLSINGLGDQKIEVSFFRRVGRRIRFAFRKLFKRMG